MVMGKFFTGREVDVHQQTVCSGLLGAWRPVEEFACWGDEQQQLNVTCGFEKKAFWAAERNLRKAWLCHASRTLLFEGSPCAWHR